MDNQRATRAQIYELRQPDSAEDWAAYHEIRRKVFFEERGNPGGYQPNHPDELKEGHHPLLLHYKGIPIGNVRVDLKGDGRAVARLVGILKAYRGQGHGGALMWLVEDFARAWACTEIVLNSTKAALSFYKRLGYAEREWDATEREPHDIQVVKNLSGRRGGTIV